VVVGAGLTGLTAALDLRDLGWDVVVLEARERVGGRVHTLYGQQDGVALAAGLRAEAGGESIDDNHDQLQAMLRRFGIGTERRAQGSTDRELKGVVGYRGRTYPTADFVALRGGAVLTDYGRVTTELEKLAEQHRLDPEHPDAADDAAGLDQRSFADFVDGLGLVPEARFLAEQANVSLYAAELRDLSLLFVAQQTAVVAGVPDSASETMRVAGGNSTLPRAMAAALGPAVMTGVPVTAVTRASEAITVIAGNRQFYGAHVVLAVPPMPLRSVRFDPPLPSTVRAALDGLDLGPATKVISQYRSASWRAQGGSGFSLSDLTYRISWDSADSYQADAGLLTAFTTANNGLALASLDDAQRIARVQGELIQTFPSSAAELVGRAATVAWPNEPFTGGGYAAYKPQQLAPFWVALRSPLDRIHFAGEHLEALAGYMESAVRSGHRVARAIGKP
jgi:monoamine oxidase